MSIFSSSSISTSLRISATEVTILRYDTQNQKIASLYQQPLTQSTITPGKVANPNQLEAAVKTAVSQSRAHGAPVILGFPEDKTFSTLIDLPDVSTADLNEAMYWQAEEILPVKLNDIYFDWKRVKPPPQAEKPPAKKNQAFIVSVPKTFMDPFITACLKAGVKPISCEPTSISLARLTPNQACLIVEVRQRNSTLIAVDASSIIRISTVISDPTKLIPEIKRMHQFYQTKYNQNLTNLYVCGEGANSQWQEFLKTQAGLKITPLPLPQIKNLPKDYARFTVSLSLSLKIPEPPKHHHTINLLPKELEQQYQTASEKKTLSSGFKAAIATTVITAIILFIGIVTIRIGISQTRTQIIQEEEIASQTSYSELAKDAESANAQARIIKRIPAKDQLLTLVTELETAIPSGITLISYALDIPDRVLIINGLASTRDNLLDFKNQLEASEQFRLVTIPLPTLESNQDIQFSIAVDIAGAK